MANTHKVLRQFTGAGMVRNPGDLVDGSEFVSLKALEDQRYLERVDTATPMVGGAGSSPDPKLIQEEQARENRRKGKGDAGGGIAGLPETIEGDGEGGDGEQGDKGDGTTEETATTLRGKLPEDFPGHAALVKAGITSYGKVRAYMKTGELTSIPGIGDATAAQIEEIMGASTSEDDESGEGDSTADAGTADDPKV